MGKFEDTQYRKLSQRLSTAHSEREHDRQAEKVTKRDMKNTEGRK